VALDRTFLREARQARDRLIDLQRKADMAQVDYQHAVRRLHAAGGSLRQIAEALGISYQRVHQIVDVASGKGAVKKCEIDASCSFCGTHSSKVAKLIAGPEVFICDDCVGLARGVVGEGYAAGRNGIRVVSTDRAESAARCSFCGRKRNRVDAMAAAPDRPLVGKFAPRSGAMRVCDKCVALCEEILREELAGM
jgi:hypothetical protein